jgi:hypothetical protein
MRPRLPSSHRQAGNALLILAVVLATIAATAMLKALSSRSNGNQQATHNAKVLAQAKAALIASAVAAATPGQLPCPDRNGDGQQDTPCGNQAGTTGQALRLGRLPWKDLGLEELKDSGGQTLWYAVSNNFKSNTAIASLNSNTLGTILVRNANNQAVQNPGNGTGAIAVIIAAGANGLDRYASGAFNENNANFTDNSSSDGFIQGPIQKANGSIAVDDQLVFIAYEDLLPLVEQRVAGEVLQAVTTYNQTNVTTARPAGFADPSCLNLTQAFIACPSSNPDCSTNFAATPRTIAIDCPSNPLNSLCPSVASPNRIELVCSGGSAISLACSTGNCGSLTLANSAGACANNPTTGPFTIYPCSGKTYSAGPTPLNCGRIPQSFGALPSAANWNTLGTGVIDPSSTSGWFWKNNWRELTLLAYPPGMIPNSTGCGSGTAQTLDIRVHHANEPDPNNPNTAAAPTAAKVVTQTPLVMVGGRMIPSQQRATPANQTNVSNYFEAPLTNLPNPVYQQANPLGPIWWTGRSIANVFNDTVRWSAP